MKKHKHKKDNRLKDKNNSGKKQGDIVTITAVNCYRGNIVSLVECKACENHRNMSCMLNGMNRKIEILPAMQPMMFNRTMFQNISDQVREDSINYYFKTDVLNDVNTIAEYPNYHTYKHKYIQGAYAVQKDEEPDKQYPFDRFNVMLYLKQDSTIMNCDIMMDEKMYTITQPFSQPGEWYVKMYLYNVFSLDGFADIKIMGVGYKVMFKPVDGYPIDYIIAINGDKAIVGKILEHKP